MKANFEIGEGVFWIDRKFVCNPFSDQSLQWLIRFGTVLEIYPGYITLQLYEFPREDMIEGIPVKAFHTPTEWRKLPKGWTWNTPLIEWSTFDAMPENWKNRVLPTGDKDAIRQAINDGVFIPVCENEHAQFNTEITKQGWRIVRSYPYYQKNPNTVTLMTHEVYKFYDSAHAKVLADDAELKRQSELTDEQWSIEQIEHDLNRLKALGYPDDVVNYCREFLLGLDRIEDVETRIVSGGLQWKYWKNKRWNCILL